MAPGSVRDVKTCAHSDRATHAKIRVPVDHCTDSVVKRETLSRSTWVAVPQAVVIYVMR